MKKTSRDLKYSHFGGNPAGNEEMVKQVLI